MKLDYFTLLYPKSIAIYGVGHVKPIFLREIGDITISRYNSYINLINMDVDDYYELIHSKEDDYLTNYSEEEKSLILEVEKQYNDVSIQDKVKVSFIDIVRYDSKIMERLVSTLNFFFEETVKYISEEHTFILFKNEIVDGENIETPVGAIVSSTYREVMDVILQRNGVGEKEDKNKEIEGVTDERVLKMWAKMQEGQRKLDAKKNREREKDFSLGNIISAVAAHNEVGLNLINIWDLTIYGLYDQFKRLRINEFHEVSMTNISVWGNDKSKYDVNTWFKNMENK